MKTTTKFIYFLISALLFFSLSCKDFQETNSNITYDFEKLADRPWVGEDFFAFPLEDWRLREGRLESIGFHKNARANILTQELTGTGNFSLKAKMGILENTLKKGSVGFEIGLQDATDNDVRSLCFYGNGIKVGVSTDGFLFIDETTVVLPNDFDFKKFELNIEVQDTDMSVTVIDQEGIKISLDKQVNELKGIITLATHLLDKVKSEAANTFWFDDIQMSGSMLKPVLENSFGPMLFNMYTLSRGTLKMSVQFAPLGITESKNVVFQIASEEDYKTVQNATIEADTRIAIFKVTDWDNTKDYKYRLLYEGIDLQGETKTFNLEGIIPKEPKNGELKVAGFTCQQYQAYPYKPLVNNIKKTNPDLLFFSGDQIYEQNGGYPIVREGVERTILSYLGRWYMYGWAFKDVLKNKPTICITDDHEVYQGNLWGENGKKISIEDWKKNADDIGGFVQPAKMVDVVMRTNCAHLPDPYDPTPMENDISVYYTDLLYGDVSFAILADRTFKSGPEKVSFWKGRKDHLNVKLDDPSQLEIDGLQMLGNRQLLFLEDWVNDWEGATMKCVLTQTIFSNTATHHGAEKEFLYGDLDSGGWPKSGRDKALELIRKTASFHICGDQHLTVMEQYGIDEPRDAGWAFCTPAISVGYERRFLPDLVYDIPNDRSVTKLPNTGSYIDAFRNHFYVQAIGNPEDNTKDANRYEVAQKRASGFGLITFNTENRTITSDAIRFLPNNETGKLQSFEGWPFTINQLDNFGIPSKYKLPELVFDGIENPVVQIFNASDDLILSIRIKGKTFQPYVRELGDYKIQYSTGEENSLKKNKIVTAIRVNDVSSSINLSDTNK